MIHSMEKVYLSMFVFSVSLFNLHIRRVHSANATLNHSTVHELLNYHGASSTIVIYDEFAVHKDWLTYLGEDERRYTIYYKYEQFRRFLELHMKYVLSNHDTMADYRKNLNFLLVCSAQCVESTITYATELDNTVGFGSLLRHFSTWMILTFDFLPHIDTVFDHVTVLQVNHRRYENNLSIHTLMWGTEGRRWSPVSVEDVPPDRRFPTLFPNTLTGLNGRQLVLGTLPWIGDVIRHVTNGTVTYSGVGIEVFDSFKSTYNFTYIIVEPEDELWGQNLNNGTVTGVMGMVARGEVDTCPSPYGKTYMTSRVVSFSSHVRTTDVKAFYIMPRIEDRSWLYLLSCFKWPVYLLGLTTFLAFLLQIAGVAKFNQLNIPHGPSVLSYGFGLGLRVILRQDIMIHPTSPSAKVLQYTWCLFCLVMTTVYTGNLVATTAVSNTVTPFNTIEELADRDDFAIGVLEGSYTQSIMMASRDPVMRALYARVSKAGVGSTDEGIEHEVKKLMKGNYVMFGSNPVRRYMAAKTCDYKELPEILNPLHNSFIFPQHSPLRKLFDEQILQLRDTGIIGELEKTYDPQEKICVNSNDPPRQNMDSLKTLFVTVAGCVSISIIVLILELKVSRCVQIPR